MTGKVLFVSQNQLERAENIRAVWDAYEGDKEFRVGIDNMAGAEHEGFAVVVCDTLSKYIDDKDSCKCIAICHAITGNKYYGLDEPGDWVDPEAFAQTDYAISASVDSIPIVARQLGIPEHKVIPTGIPRTDAYVGAKKGDGNTILANKRAYLYVPTYRDVDKGWLPYIDWAYVDSLMGDDEVFAVKRHYFTAAPIVDGEYEHVIELDPMEPVGQYLIDCDVLLTDYSSIEFDGYLLGKPAVLTTDDMDVYLADRGMYFDYPDFYSSRSMRVEGQEDEMVYMMRNAARFGLNETERRCIAKLAGMCDGYATKRVCDLIRHFANA